MTPYDRRHLRPGVDAETAMRDMADVVREAMQLVLGVQRGMQSATGMGAPAADLAGATPGPDARAAFREAQELIDRASGSFGAEAHPTAGPGAVPPAAPVLEETAESALEDALETLIDPTRIRVPTFGMEKNRDG